MKDKAYRIAQKFKDKKFKDCSCWMCGNERKYSKGKHKLTLQERKADEQNLSRHAEMED